MGQLTAVGVRAIKEPGRYIDGDGLMLLVKSETSRNWVLRATIAGKRRDLGLGSLKTVTLAEAREIALDYRRKIARGIDPAAERRKIANPVPTFRVAAATLHEENKTAWKNGKHQDQWINTLTTYAFPLLGDRLVNDIEGPLIRDVLAPIWLAKPETARRVRQRIGSVLDWSYANGHRPTEAPMRSLAKGLPRQPRKDGHFAAMAYRDVPALIARLRERSSIGRVALEVLILTAVRSGEVRGARWRELDLEAGLWSIPAERMKMGKAHLVPLAPATVDAFRRAAAFRMPCSDLVFPGQAKPRPLDPDHDPRDARRPLSDMTLLKIMRDFGTGVTVHGFRSSFRDWAAEESDYPGEVAEAALAHTVANKVEAAYRRTVFLDKRRGLMRDWAAFCERSGTGSSG